MTRAARVTTLASCIALVAGGCGERGPKPKVLVIGIDGVRPDVLEELDTPSIDALRAAGAYAGDVQSQAQTISGAAWSSILTGVWPGKHGVTSNDFHGNDYATYPDFLTRLENLEPEFGTFAVVDWPPLGTEASGGPLIGDGIDAKLAFDGDEAGYRTADSLSVAAAIRYLRNQDPDAAFVYIGYPDLAAHEHGARAPEYRAAIEIADAQVGQLLAALRDRPTFTHEDWLILIVTDHGHRDEGGHGGTTPDERGVFYLASGPSASRGFDTPPNLVDVAVTAMAHLGIQLRSSWDLDGKVSGLR